MIKNISNRGLINLSSNEVEIPSQNNIDLFQKLKAKYHIGLFRSENPQSKKFFSETYIKDGEFKQGTFSLKKENAWFQESVYSTESFDNMLDFANFVQNNVTCKDYMTTGILSQRVLDENFEAKNFIVTENKNILERQKELDKDSLVFSRTKTFITGNSNAGIMCLDVDSFEGKLLTLDETLEKIFEGLPELKEAPMVIFPSTGSNIYGKTEVGTQKQEDVEDSGKNTIKWVNKSGEQLENSDIGAVELQGINGFHIFVGIKSTNWLTQGLFERINQRMWLKGGGFVKISSNGNLLERCLIDTSVLKPVQPIYTNANITDPRLFQRLGEPWFINPNAEPFNLLNIDKLSEEDMVTYQGLVSTKKALLEEEAEKIKSAWALKQAEQSELAKSLKEGDESAYKLTLKVLKDSYLKTATDKTLSGTQEVYLTPLIKKTGQLITTDTKTDIHGTKFIVRTIENILESPDLYHGARCACIEDLYYAPGGSENKAKLIDYTRARIYIKNEPFPRIHDFAHGGVSYRLLRDKIAIDLVVDNNNENLRVIVDKLNDRKAAFKRKKDIYVVMENETSGKVRLEKIDPPYWSVIVRDHFSFFRTSPKGERIQEDVSVNIRDQTMSMFSIGERGDFRALTSIPFLDTSGKLDVKTGYNERTKFIFYEDNGNTGALRADHSRFGSFKDVSKMKNITIEDMKDALEIVEGPIRLYKFKDKYNMGNMLGAMFTIVLKQWFNDSNHMYPGFMADGPDYGIGKTKLLNILGVLLLGKEPGATTIEGDATELNKQICGKLADGQDFFFFDNVDKKVSSATLASLITSKSISFRTLGTSNSTEFENTCFITLSGQNLKISSELTRRFMGIRIEPVESNYLTHEFEFEPVSYTLENRNEMLKALMVLYMGYKQTLERGYLGAEEIYGGKDNGIRDNAGQKSNGIGEVGIGRKFDNIVNELDYYAENEGWYNRKDAVDMWVSGGGYRNGGEGHNGIGEFESRNGIGKCEIEAFNKNLTLLGSFEEWSKEVGGCVKFIGQFIAESDGEILKLKGDIEGDNRMREERKGREHNEVESNGIRGGCVGNGINGVADFRDFKYGMPGGKVNEMFQEKMEKSSVKFNGFMKVICDCFRVKLLKYRGRKTNLKVKWHDIGEIHDKIYGSKSRIDVSGGKILCLTFDEKRSAEEKKEDAKIEEKSLMSWLQFNRIDSSQKFYDKLKNFDGKYYAWEKSNGRTVVSDVGRGEGRQNGQNEDGIIDVGFSIGLAKNRKVAVFSVK